MHQVKKWTSEIGREMGAGPGGDLERGGHTTSIGSDSEVDTLSTSPWLGVRTMRRGEARLEETSRYEGERGTVELNSCHHDIDVKKASRLSSPAKGSFKTPIRLQGRNCAKRAERSSTAIQIYGDGRIHRRCTRGASTLTWKVKPPSSKGRPTHVQAIASSDSSVRAVDRLVRG